MNDTTRRFLLGILDRVPESRIVEVRLFPAIRQGGVESGFAVLAVDPGFDEVPDATVATDHEEPLAEVVAAEDEVARADEAVAEVEVQLAVPASDLPDPGDSLLIGRADPIGSRAVELADEVAAGFEQERVMSVAREGVPDESPPAVMGDATASDLEVAVDASVADDGAAVEGGETIALGDILALPSPVVAVPPTREGRERLAILCARYRLVVKGPDRGKWELEIVHQADAPLATLDRVIAGVVRRSGEETEPERLTAAALRERLDAPPWVDGAAA